MTNLSIRIHAFVVGKMISFQEFRHDERGQDLLEWVLLSGLVAAGIVAVLGLFTGALQTMVGNIGNCIDFNNATPCKPGF